MSIQRDVYNTITSGRAVQMTFPDKITLEAFRSALHQIRKRYDKYGRDLGMGDKISGPESIVFTPLSEDGLTVSISMKNINRRFHGLTFTILEPSPNGTNDNDST